MSNGFIDSDLPEGQTMVFLQWKGTNACLDFNCECGAHVHVDDDFVYAIRCPECAAIWEMPAYLFPRRNDAFEGIVTDIK